MCCSYITEQDLINTYTNILKMRSGLTRERLENFFASRQCEAYGGELMSVPY